MKQGLRNIPILKFSGDRLGRDEGARVFFEEFFAVIPVDVAVVVGELGVCWDLLNGAEDDVEDAVVVNGDRLAVWAVVVVDESCVVATLLAVDCEGLCWYPKVGIHEAVIIDVPEEVATRSYKSCIFADIFPLFKRAIGEKAVPDLLSDPTDGDIRDLSSFDLLPMEFSEPKSELLDFPFLVSSSAFLPDPRLGSPIGKFELRVVLQLKQLFEPFDRDHFGWGIGCEGNLNGRH